MLVKGRTFLILLLLVLCFLVACDPTPTPITAGAPTMGPIASPTPTTQTTTNQDPTVIPCAQLPMAVLDFGVLPGWPIPPTMSLTTTTSGLNYVDLVMGEGPQPQSTQHVTLHYTGYLLRGTMLDPS